MTYLPKKKKSLFRRLLKSSFIVVYFLLLVVLIISLSAKYIDSNTWILPSVFSLGFPFTFIVFLIFTIIALYRKYFITLLIALPFFIWGLTVFNRFLNFSSILKKENCSTNQSFKVLSFNVRLFDVYSWKTNHPNHQNILDFIVNQSPDIACFQEYYYQSDGKYITTDFLLKGLKTKNIHAYFPVVNRKSDYFGIATITRYPIVNKGEITFSGTSNMCIFTDVLINKDTVRIYNMHLESVRLGNEDYAFIANIEHKPDDVKIEKSKSVLRRLISASKKRNIQAYTIALHIHQCPYPVIVCGDFNDTPASYTYSIISKNLIDSYSLMDKNLGSTYNGNIPFLRIDYILHSPYFNSCQYQIHRIDVSDHFPITCTLSLQTN
ncbi:MAG: endonuclease/exonuclease/phosphatase family protein [Bacteroidales bacterium]|jgi:endonuclease/exonuclease/phosphatase family metal-dependent hydrolase|nr:endonuclease/exonuclease/phosphatase family protein [Bacteroidales bacterium]